MNFALLERNIQNINYLYFLGGFVEGEGSNSVSVTINKNFKFGVNIQPVFNVSQHKNGGLFHTHSYYIHLKNYLKVLVLFR